MFRKFINKNQGGPEQGQRSAEKASLKLPLIDDAHYKSMTQEEKAAARVYAWLEKEDVKPLDKEEKTPESVKIDIGAEKQARKLNEQKNKITRSLDDHWDREEQYWIKQQRKDQSEYLPSNQLRAEQQQIVMPAEEKNSASHLLFEGFDQVFSEITEPPHFQRSKRIDVNMNKIIGELQEMTREMSVVSSNTPGSAIEKQPNSSTSPYSTDGHREQKVQWQISEGNNSRSPSPLYNSSRKNSRAPSPDSSRSESSAREAIRMYNIVNDTNNNIKSASKRQTIYR